MFGKRPYDLIDWTENEFRENQFEKSDDNQAVMTDFLSEEKVDPREPVDEFEVSNSNSHPWLTMPSNLFTGPLPTPNTVPVQPVVQPHKLLNDHAYFLHTLWSYANAYHWDGFDRTLNQLLHYPLAVPNLDSIAVQGIHTNKSLLLVAAENGQWMAVKKLVGLGVKGKERNGFALWYAIVAKEWDAVERLLRANVCDVNLHPRGTQAVLWYLAKSHKWKLVEMLLRNNDVTEINSCSPTKPNAYFTALDFANKSKVKFSTLNESRRLLKAKGGVANVIVEPGYYYPENKRKNPLQQPAVLYHSEQSRFSSSSAFFSSAPCLSDPAKAPAWTSYREKMPGSLAEWVEYFYQITENINSRRGAVNCYYCALKTNEYLANGFTQGEAPVTKEPIKYFLTHERRRHLQFYCENQSLVSICPIDRANHDVVEDLTLENKEVIEVDLTEEKQGALRVKFLKTTASQLLDRLKEMPKRQKDGTSYGFLYLKHINGSVGHIMNYFVTPDNDVIFIDAQYHQHHHRKHRRVITNLTELLLNRYRDNVAYINALPPEGFAIKKEAGVDIHVPDEMVVKKEPEDEASYSASSTRNKI